MTRWAFAVLLIAGVGFAGDRVFAADHPLDPLSKEEIAAAVEVLKAAGKVTPQSRYPAIVLQEPPKDEVLRFRPGAPMRREAFLVVYEHASRKTFEAIVDLRNRAVVSWKERPGVQPLMMLEELDTIIPKAVRSDPRWREAMQKRGITDLENVQLDPWPAGYYGIPGEEGHRLAKAVAFYRGSAINAYARPVEGVVAVVDLDEGKVLKVVNADVVSVPKATADLDEKSIGKQREAPKPLEAVQSRGASYAVEGNEVRWQNWRFRFAMHPREGLVLYTVGYEDQGKLRPVLYRGSLSEMIVPYADPGPAWYFRNVFDEGEYGLGLLADSLDPLADAPANASFFAAVLADDKGNAFEIPQAIALYERDGGLLWKHYDYETKHNESRRARELVLGYITTVGNYEYGFNWVFHQDGTLEMEALLTGIMEPEGVAARSAENVRAGNRHAHLVAENVAAVHHQHFFCFRLDLDVDGTANSVVEVNTAALPPGPGSPRGRAFVSRETPLRHEQEAMRQLDAGSSRFWKVVNPVVKNALGQAVGYALVPGENSVPYESPASWARKRAGFLNAHFWATPYDAKEMYAAGDYPNQSKGGEGLPKWTGANRSIENTDLVVWYTFGVTHIPRPEEWPVMAVHKTGFKLVPSSFFSRNPALDVPRPEAAP